MSALQRLAYPGLVALAYAVSPFSAKVRDGLGGRRGLAERVRAATRGWPRPLWFHVASSGELEQAIPILEATKRRESGGRIFLSYFSPSAGRGIALERERRREAGLAVPWDAADFAPFDFDASVEAFLDALNPRTFIAIHREIWPGLLAGCRRRKIPRYLFAAYFPRGRAGRLPLYRDGLREFDFIGTTGEETAALLRERLGEEGPVVRALGDPRVERVLSRKAMRPAAPWTTAFDGQRVIVLASVWPKDLRAAAPALEEAVASLPGLRLVVVPHEPKGEFPGQILRWLEGRGLPARLWSKWLGAPDRDSHLVVDGVGFLAELYRVATVVFVGGSFQARVHNVLEPAAYGKPIFTGPYIENSGEACELRERGLLVRVSGASELSRQLRLLLADPEALVASADGIRDYLAARAGAGESYAEILAGLGKEKKGDGFPSPLPEA